MEAIVITHSRDRWDDALASSALDLGRAAARIGASVFVADSGSSTNLDRTGRGVSRPSA